MYLSEGIFDINGFYDIGTAFFLITIVSPSMKRFMKKLNNSVKDTEDWKRFEVNFKELHEDFFERLLKEYPNLTPKDLKLCAYLKMNLSTKEIAPLMAISIRGIEIHRYRLRKKLKIDSSENLSNFLITF